MRAGITTALVKYFPKGNEVDDGWEERRIDNYKDSLAPSSTPFTCPVQFFEIKVSSRLHIIYAASAFQSEVFLTMKICNRITLGIAGVFGVIAAFLYTTGERVLQVRKSSIDTWFFKQNIFIIFRDRVRCFRMAFRCWLSFRMIYGARPENSDH